MRYGLTSLVCCVALAGCALPWVETRELKVLKQATVQCGDQATCEFAPTPLRVLPEPIRIEQRPFPFFATAETLRFQDALGGTWIAPARTLTDGASIPPIFVPMLGNPTRPEYRLAAAMHDAYCGIGNENGPVFHAAEWPFVHRMFYDALIAGGTEMGQAQLMFAAVWLGGPRWSKVRQPGPLAPQMSFAETWPGVQTEGVWDSLRHVPDSAKIAALGKIKRMIAKKQPDLSELVTALVAIETDWREDFPRVKDRHPEKKATKVAKKVKKTTRKKTQTASPEPTTKPASNPEDSDSISGEVYPPHSDIY